MHVQTQDVDAQQAGDGPHADQQPPLQRHPHQDAGGSARRAPRGNMRRTASPFGPTRRRERVDEDVIIPRSGSRLLSTATEERERESWNEGEETLSVSSTRVPHSPCFMKPVPSLCHLTPTNPAETFSSGKLGFSACRDSCVSWQQLSPHRDLLPDECHAASRVCGRILRLGEGNGRNAVGDITVTSLGNSGTEQSLELSWKPNKLRSGNSADTFPTKLLRHRNFFLFCFHVKKWKISPAGNPRSSSSNGALLLISCAQLLWLPRLGGTWKWATAAGSYSNTSREREGAQSLTKKINKNHTAGRTRHKKCNVRVRFSLSAEVKVSQWAAAPLAGSEFTEGRKGTGSGSETSWSQNDRKIKKLKICLFPKNKCCFVGFQTFREFRATD